MRPAGEAVDVEISATPAVRERPQRQFMKRSYSAFLSYGHGADSALAAALQHALHRFAKPWYRPRAMQVFRDKTDLSANTSLWQALVRAIEASRWLVLLASAESAASGAVAREIVWWREHRSARHVLLVLTDGELIWDDTARDFDWSRTGALNRTACAGLFEHEPLWVDLRPFRDAKTQTLRNAGFREAIADIAAPLRGVSKQALIDRDREEHRRLLFAAGVTSLVIVGLAYAVWRTDEISRARKDTIASHELAGKAYLTLPNNPELSALLALAGYARRQTGLAEVALRHALAHLSSAPPALEPELGGQAAALSWSRTGQSLALARADGRVLLWDGKPADPLRHLDPVLPAQPAALTWGPGDTLAAAAGNTIVRWPSGSRSADNTTLPAQVLHLWFTPAGALLAALADGRVIEAGQMPTEPDAAAIGQPPSAFTVHRGGRLFALGASRSPGSSRKPPLPRWRSTHAASRCSQTSCSRAPMRMATCSSAMSRRCSVTRVLLRWRQFSCPLKPEASSG